MSRRASFSYRIFAAGVVVCFRQPGGAPGQSAGTGFSGCGDCAATRRFRDGAEQKIRAELLATHPDEAEALSLLGVALDNQKKFQDANDAHLGAIAKDPNSPGMLHNYGNHLLLTGDLKGAHDTFMKLVELDPNDDYANLQLAQLALSANDAKEALQYLERLPTKQTESPTVAIYMLLALDLTGNHADADKLFASLAASTEKAMRILARFSRPKARAQAGQFAQAEDFSHECAGARSGELRDAV